MIKKLWDAIHFGKFKSQWRHPLKTDENNARAEMLTRTIFYESRIEETEDGPMLVTQNGGLIGRMTFYLMLPVYALFAAGMFTGTVSLLDFALFEAIFIGVFGLANGWAIHKLVQEPDFGLEELSLRRVEAQ